MEGEEWVADRFQKSPPMSTYLLTFTVCQFQSQQANTTRGYTVSAQPLSLSLSLTTPLEPPVHTKHNSTERRRRTLQQALTKPDRRYISKSAINKDNKY